MSTTKTKISPDGSLPRLTSHVKDVKDIANLMKIIKIPNDGVEDSAPLYKLGWVGSEDGDSEESEESDEEVWNEDEISNFHLLEQNTDEPDLNTDSVNKANTIDIVDKPTGNREIVKNNNNRNNNHRAKFTPNQKNKDSVRKNFNSSGILNRSTQNTSCMEKDNYNCNRSFYSHGRSYKQNVSSLNIDPWIRPPMAMNALPPYQYQSYAYGSPVENIRPVPRGSGLLGEAPPNFQPSTQNDEFRCPPNYYNEFPANNYQRFGPAPEPMLRVSNPPNYERGRMNGYWKKNNKSRNWNRRRSFQRRNAMRSNYTDKKRN